MQGHELRPLILEGSYSNIKLDEYVTQLADLRCDRREDLYEQVFLSLDKLEVAAEEPTLEFNTGHYSFIVLFNDSTHGVITVAGKPVSKCARHIQTYSYDALLTKDKGYERFNIILPEHPPLCKWKEAIMEEIKIFCQGQCKEIYDVYDNEEFAKDFIKLEQKHSQVCTELVRLTPKLRTNMKMAVMYAKEGQKHASDWFANGTGCENLPEKFWKLMNFFGKEVDMTEWEKYNGDMGKRGKAYYDEWNNVECIFHVACKMDEEQHRRLIGNDIAVLFVLDEGDYSFDPSNISELGTVPQLWVVAQPVGDMWRVGSFQSINLSNHEPHPPTALLDLAQVKDFVLTKIYNGLVMTNYCPPLNRLFYMPRSSTLESILEKYPSLSGKEKRAREKEWKMKKQEDNRLPVVKREREMKRTTSYKQKQQPLKRKSDLMPTDYPQTITKHIEAKLQLQQMVVSLKAQVATLLVLEESTSIANSDYSAIRKQLSTSIKEINKKIDEHNEIINGLWCQAIPTTNSTGNSPVPSVSTAHALPTGISGSSSSPLIPLSSRSEQKLKTSNTTSKNFNTVKRRKGPKRDVFGMPDEVPDKLFVIFFPTCTGTHDKKTVPNSPTVTVRELLTTQCANRDVSLDSFIVHTKNDTILPDLDIPLAKVPERVIVLEEVASSDRSNS